MSRKGSVARRPDVRGRPVRGARAPVAGAGVLAGALALGLAMLPAPAAAQASGGSPALEAVQAEADSGHADRARRDLERWLHDRGPKAGTAARAHAEFLRARLATNLDSAALVYTSLAIGGVQPWAAAARLRLAQLHLARGQYDRALSDLETLRADFPGDSLAHRSWAWTGDVLAASGDSSRACQAWVRAEREAGSDTALAARAERSAVHCPGAASSRPSAGASPAAGPEQRWAVQLGAFSTRAAAETLRERAARAGFQVRVVDTSARDGLYRVWTQDVPDAASADALRDRVAAAGFSAITVQPGGDSSSP